MIPYQTKSNKLSGNSYGEIRNNAFFVFNRIKKKTKRRPYVRAPYFNKEKIFFDYFWKHLFQKSPKERCVRLRYFKAAIEVIEKSKNDPISTENPHKKGEILHRFAGFTKNKELFYVQIKQDKRSGAKYFMSCFPDE